MYVGFPHSLIASLRCPADNATIVYSGAEEHLTNAQLSCASCKRQFEVRDGIVLMTEQDTLPPHLVSEMKARDSEAKTYDAHLAHRYHREIEPTLREIGSLKNKNVIEYGAGTGRFTELLSQESGLFLATDISLESLYVLTHKNIPRSVGLVCADATAFPTAPSFFDAALALQVIEHMPAPSIRERFYKLTKITLKPGGFFVASVYHQDLRRILHRQPIDGAHANGVPFHFFSVHEFQFELRRVFKNVRARAIDIVLPLEKRLRFPERLQGMISRICEYIPLVNKYGHLVLAKAS